VKYFPIFVDLHNRPVLLVSLNEAGFEPPTHLRQVAELALQHRFDQELAERRSSLDLVAYGKALEIPTLRD
jgi:hypothetical protein